MDLKRATRAIRTGAILGFVVTGLSLAIVLLGLATGGFGNSTGLLADLADPLNLLDTLLVGLLSFGVLRRSRVAAVALVAYYLLERTIFVMEYGSTPGLVLAVLILLAFGNAARGTFAYHRRRREADPDYRAAASRRAMWLWGAGAVVFILLGGLAILGMLMQPTHVMSAAEIPAGDLATMREHGILEPGEQPIYLYSAGFFSVLNDGNLLTDRRVVSWQTLDGELEIASARLEDIVDVTVETPAGFVTDALVTIETIDGWIQVILSGEAGGDQAFLDELAARMRDR